MRTGTVIGVIATFTLGGISSMMLRPEQHSRVADTALTRNMIVLNETKPLDQEEMLERMSSGIQPAETSLKDKVVTDEVNYTEEQQVLYDRILTKLLNPDYVQSVKIAEVLQEADQLTPAQKNQLIASAKKMIARGELDLRNFKKPELKRYQTIAEGAPLPTLEEQAQFDQLSAKLHDPAYTKSITYISLASEIQTFPPALKQEVADHLNGMLENGDLDPGSFMGSSFSGKNIKIFLN